MDERLLADRADFAVAEEAGGGDRADGLMEGVDVVVGRAVHAFAATETTEQHRAVRPGTLRALGFAIAIVLLGALNPWVKQKALEERLGIRDDTWQQALLLFVWALVIAVIYFIILELVEWAIKKRKR